MACRRELRADDRRSSVGPAWHALMGISHNRGAKLHREWYGEVPLNNEKRIFEDVELLNELRAAKFDVALFELYDWSAVAVFEFSAYHQSLIECFLLFFDMLAVEKRRRFLRKWRTLAAVTSVQQGLYTSYSDEMSFWERLDNFKFAIEMHYRLISWQLQLHALARKVSPGFPHLQDLIKQKTGIILMNVNEFTESPRPTANIVRYVGGSTIYEPKPLDEKLSAILERRSENVLFSLGSLATSKGMPMWLKQDIMNAFSAFPNTTFIWKYEDEDDAVLFERHSNIVLMKWVPQTDLLANKRLSLFITHAGKNSVLEAMSFGKPMVAIPLFADQILNAKIMKRRGLGLVINRRDLNCDTLKAAIRDVLADG
ncbi:unnamed protein product [Angiostrongylus costaricensis]|uniref:UDP-glucuronosyltransferase n=1 Tax=Angiostrongylus costaricensis TaxID=334426 RepID=A0A0R3PB31_ANGCS|nr:unnamed protein product [Angiostrongylus costaricensis]